MMTVDGATAGKPATAARIYDYFLGGIHNFPADQEAAKQIISRFPFIPQGAQANRVFLRRAVRYLADAGIRQFLDIGSGIPTAGNVHEIAQEAAPDARVVYVDIDPVAVAESLEILAGNDQAVAVRADLREPHAILDHPQVRKMLNFSQPTALLLAAVLHFMPDDEQARSTVDELVAALAPGSYLLISHAAVETFNPESPEYKAIQDLYKRQTTTPAKLRTRAETERFFAGLELVEPGVVWLAEWRPEPGTPNPFADNPARSSAWAGVGRKV
jgi:SAM-dependent methyltransferase